MIQPTPGIGLSYGNRNEWINAKESIHEELTQIDDQEDMREKDVESQRLLSSFDLKTCGALDRIREDKVKHGF